MYIIGEEEIQAVRRVIESKQLFRYRGGEGGETDQFEQAWAARTGARHALLLTSGTAALTCALAGMGIGPGDEVIVPAYTWIATALAPLAVGAIPIMAEVDTSLTLDPADVKRKITPRTKAIIPVHICGFPSDMDNLLAIALEHNLRVLEDSCQADGGSYKGKSLGTLGCAGAFSFNHFKIIAAGEGGSLVTDDPVLYDRAVIYHDTGCVFRDHASSMRDPIYVGTCYRMNEVIAAILRVQLGRLDGILDTLRREKRILREKLSGCSAFTFNPVHDLEGDCGTTLGLLFETPSQARSFINAAAEEGVSLSSPIDSGRHIYTNWEPVMQKRGAHHPDRNPYLTCGYEVQYSEDMCPRTLEYLARTVYVATAVNRPEDDLLRIADVMLKLAANMA